MLGGVQVSLLYAAAAPSVSLEERRGLEGQGREAIEEAMRVSCV
jgi:hypothetical protein